MQSSPPFTAVGWKPRILVGILAGILAVVLGWQGFFEVVERPFYDQQVRLLAPLNPISEEIVLLTLDDESLERMRDSLGSWRWPRIVFGGVIDYCEEARSICFGLPPAPEGEQYGETHAILEEEIRAFGSLACGCRLDASELEAPILPGLSRFFLDIEDGPTASPRFSRIDFPCLEMLSGSATMGFIDHHPDSDGLVRAVLPCVRVYDYWLPSLSMAGHFSGLNGASSRVGWIDQGLGFVVGENAFYCRSDGSVLLRPSNQHYQRIPLADIFESIRAEIEGRIPSVSRGFFVGKHVLIGSTASGALGRVYQTPLPRLRDEIEISAVLSRARLGGCALDPRLKSFLWSVFPEPPPAGPDRVAGVPRFASWDSDADPALRRCGPSGWSGHDRLRPFGCRRRDTDLGQGAASAQNADGGRGDQTKTDRHVGARPQEPAFSDHDFTQSRTRAYIGV